jgi:hypothetical protein
VDDHAAAQLPADPARCKYLQRQALLQDTAIKEGVEEKSTPETLTTACHAAS